MKYVLKLELTFDAEDRDEAADVMDSVVEVLEDEYEGTSAKVLDLVDVNGSSIPVFNLDDNEADAALEKLTEKRDLESYIKSLEVQLKEAKELWKQEKTKFKKQ